MKAKTSKSLYIFNLLAALQDLVRFVQYISQEGDWYFVRELNVPIRL